MDCPSGRSFTFSSCALCTSNSKFRCSCSMQSFWACDSTRSLRRLQIWACKTNYSDMPWTRKSINQSTHAANEYFKFGIILKDALCFFRQLSEGGTDVSHFLLCWPDHVFNLRLGMKQDAIEFNVSCIKEKTHLEVLRTTTIVLATSCCFLPRSNSDSRISSHLNVVPDRDILIQFVSGLSKVPSAANLGLRKNENTTSVTLHDCVWQSADL